MAATNFTRTLKVSLSADGATLSGPVLSRTANANADFSEAVPAGATDKEYDIAFDADRMKLYFIIAGGDLTIKTNSSSTPGNTINVKAGVPLWFADQAGLTNLFTADVTKLFVTNAATADVQLDIRALFNATA